MPKYQFCFYEESTVYITIEAENNLEAGERADEMFCSGEIDWSMGKMDMNYEFMGETKDA